ncbi:mitoferrin-1-like [Amphiura filiformis]|uniref:mitoferrin-1-like n=1 Tax=Amphiura filiformis TaxID=82378 RepID=UPI003B2102C1
MAAGMIASRNLESSTAIPRTISKLPEYDLETVRRRIMDTDCPKQAQNSATVTVQDELDHVSQHEEENGLSLSSMFDDDDEYETLPSSTMGTHMMAGAVAGVMEHCVMYPVDSVKTRMQSIKPCPEARYTNVFNGLTTIVRKEGPLRMVRGLHVVAAGAGPAHALYFACYEKLKHTLSKTPGRNPLANAVAGSVATLIHDAAMNPVDVIKQRMQMYSSPYKNVTECIRDIVRKEGLQAFYRSYTTQLTMNIPFQVIHFVTYEWGQEFLNPERRYNPGTHVVSGAVAGAAAAAITTPLDVCKTMLNTQDKYVLSQRNGVAITGMTTAFRTIYQLGGARGYFKGVQARVIFQMPATALSWSVYEFFKHFITTKRAQ